MSNIPPLTINTGMRWEDYDDEPEIVFPLSGERLVWKVRLDELEHRVTVARKRYMSLAWHMEPEDHASKDEAYQAWQGVLDEKEELLRVIPSEFLAGFPPSPSVDRATEPVDMRADLGKVFWGARDFCKPGDEVGSERYEETLAFLKRRHEARGVVEKEGYVEMGESSLRAAFSTGRFSEESVVREAMRMSGKEIGDGRAKHMLEKRLREALVEPGTRFIE